jgi:hypothetical protein
MKYFLKKLRSREKLRKMFVERLTEPVHLNLLSLFVAALGSFETKVAFDLVVRQQNAYSLLQAAINARWIGHRSVTAIEFGVASGAGLLNICEISRAVTDATGVDFRIVGFDRGSGLPPSEDYRDMPYIFHEGAFPMVDHDRLRKELPDNAELILGDISDTVREFVGGVSEESPIGSVAVDVDYYSSAKACLEVFSDPNPKKYLPMTMVYLDDIGVPGSCPWVGELLAVREFNDAHKLRKIHPEVMLRSRRLFKQAAWIDQIYIMHALDHEWRSVRNEDIGIEVAGNPYLDIEPSRSAAEPTVERTSTASNGPDGG